MSDIGSTPRGEDFARKFARGEWAERLIIDALNGGDDYVAFQYGISRGDALETESELDSVKEPNVETVKRPDILVYDRDDFAALSPETVRLIESYAEAGPDERAEILPDLEATGDLEKAVVALESESSKFDTSEREYSSTLSVFVKDEDYTRLRGWQRMHDVPITVVQVFFDTVLAVPFDRTHPAFEGVRHGSIPNIYKEGVIVDLDSPYCRTCGEFVTEPTVVDGPESQNEIDYDFTEGGKLISSDGDPFFSGGEISLDSEVLRHD